MHAIYLYNTLFVPLAHAAILEKNPLSLSSLTGVDCEINCSENKLMPSLSCVSSENPSKLSN